MTIVEAPLRTYPARPEPQRRPAPAERPRHLRVVAPAERVRRRLTPAAGVVLTAALFATLFAIAIAHTVLVQGQIRLDRLDDQLTVEQARYQRLRNEVAEMEAPGRVVDAAQGLGMVAPDDLVYLQPGAVDDLPPAEEPGGAAQPGPTTDWSAMKPLLEAPAP